MCVPSCACDRAAPRRYSEVTVCTAARVVVERRQALTYDVVVRNPATPLAALCLWTLACGSPRADLADTPDARTTAAADAPVQQGWTSDPPCSAPATDLYLTPPASTLTIMQRGDIVRCTLGDLLSAADANIEMADAGADIATTTGVRVVRLAYRTSRSDGTPTFTTATAYLPVTPRALPAPVILIGRSTAGLADSCAPSRESRPQINYALPFASRGFVTIAPDFAGLGTDGVHAYLDNREAAFQLLDAALALRALVPGSMGDPVAALGYSQGGGIVLSAQALEHELTTKRTLRAIVAIAPEWPISTRSFGYEDVLRNPDNFTGLAGLAPPVVTVARHYGFAANRLGAAHAGDTFPADERASLISALESRCTIALGGQLNVQQPRLGDLVDETFRSQVLACIDGISSGCTGAGAAFHAWLTSDFVTADPTGAPVLIVQGLGDQVMPAAGEAACVAAKLAADGVTPTICADPTATHDSILERRIEDTVAWIEATVDGTTPPTCASQTLPACSR